MKDFKDATVPEKLDRMIEFLEKWNENITIVPEDKKYLIEIKGLIETQQKEIEELKKYAEGYKLLSYSLDNFISKDKIKPIQIIDLDGKIHNVYKIEEE